MRDKELESKKAEKKLQAEKLEKKKLLKAKSVQNFPKSRIEIDNSLGL